VSVGVLLVTHEGVGSSLLAAARTVLRLLTVPVDVLEVGWQCEPGELRHRANVLLRELDKGAGVLVLTDIFGATPANVVSDLEHGRKLARVSGLNLPMLLKVLTYGGDWDLEKLTEAARESGRNGIVSEDQNG
jgi:mannose PTS system EIIA component